MHISNYKELTENVTSNVTINTNIRQQRILELIERNSKISIQKLSEIVNVTKMTINRDLKTLKEKGFVERIGDNNNGYWKIAAKI